MDQSSIVNMPSMYVDLLTKSEEIGFDMPSDIHVGSFLKTLVASKPNGNFLELGTGTGLSLAWMLEGMDENSKIISVDNDIELVQIARGFFKEETKLQLVYEDGAKWLSMYEGDKFDLIFADAWPGKYSDLDTTLELLKIGGFYVIDDMKRQPNWPNGHEKNAASLLTELDSKENFTITKMDWSTGVVVAVKTK